MDESLKSERRRHYLGGSDAPAVCGVDPEATAADVWAEKVALDQRDRSHEHPQDGGSPLVLGRYLEDAILSWARDRLGGHLLHGEWLQDRSNPWRAATLDARTVVEPIRIVEAKTCGLLGRPAYYDDYGPDGSDQIPEHVIVQVHHQADVVAKAGLLVDEIAYVAAFLGGKGFRLYELPLSRALMDEIRVVELTFWDRYVCRNEMPPEGFSREMARRIQREPGLRQEVPKAVLLRWQAAKLRRAQADDEVEATETALWAALGLAEVGYCDAGEVKVRIVNRKGYEVGPKTFSQLDFADPLTLKKRAERAAKKAQ